MPAPRTANLLKNRIELPIFILYFAFKLSNSVKTNFIIFRTCYVISGYNKSECALLGSTNPDNRTAQLEKSVEPYAATINLVYSVIDPLSSAIVCLFVGPWSDRFGRKPFLIIPIIGQTLFYVLLAVVAFLENTSPWYVVACLIPAVLTGGTSSYFVIVLCYITDVTRDANRGMKMSIFEAVSFLGMLVGNVSSSYVFAVTSYPAVFLMSASCCFLVLIYTVFFVSESLTNRDSEGWLEGLYRLGNIADIIRTTFEKRENFRRFTVICCVIIIMLFSLQTNGDDAVIFLFLREKFHWSLEKYTTFYGGIYNVAWILWALVGVYFLHKLLKVPETVMILVGLLLILSGTLLMGFADKNWEIYTAIVLRAWGAVLSPMAASLVSKIVSNEKIGKVFAFIVFSGSISGMIGWLVYTVIYNSTIASNPGIFNFASAGMYVFEIFLISCVIAVRFVRRSEDDYDRLINECSEEQSTAEEQ